ESRGEVAPVAAAGSSRAPLLAAFAVLIAAGSALGALALSKRSSGEPPAPPSTSPPAPVATVASPTPPPAPREAEGVDPSVHKAIQAAVRTGDFATADKLATEQLARGLKLEQPFVGYLHLVRAAHRLFDGAFEEIEPIVKPVADDETPRPTALLISFCGSLLTGDEALATQRETRLEELRGKNPAYPVAARKLRVAASGRQPPLAEHQFRDELAEAVFKKTLELLEKK